MKFAIDTYKLSFWALGSMLAAGGGVLLIGSIRERSLTLAGAGGALLLAGVWGRRNHHCVILRPPAVVLRRVKRTLDLMALGYGEADDTVTVRATGTTVRVRPVGPVALLSFNFRDGGSARERYLRKTLIKYQRYSR